MAHAVLRGTPTKAQVFLEDIIQGLVAETGREDDRHSMSRILFKCLRDHPDRLALIDSHKDEQATNIELLRRSVRVARALESRGFQVGDVAVMIGWNHVSYFATYCGIFFAGLSAFAVETLMKPLELEYYFKITKPKVVFVEDYKADDVRQALNGYGEECLVVLFSDDSEETESWEHFVEPHDDSLNGYWPVELQKDSMIAMYTTGGSTGLGPPKVAPVTHAGCVAQAPTTWRQTDTFPHPTPLCLLLFNGQWIVHAHMFFTCIIYGVPLLAQSVAVNRSNAYEVIKKHKPTWMLIGPYDFADIYKDESFEKGTLDSLDTLTVIGFKPYKGYLEEVQKVLKPGAIVLNRYGMTEAHGFICEGDPTSLEYMGPIANIFEYKLINEDGKEVGKNKSGELCLRSEITLAKTYYGDDEAARSMYTEDGWFHTGDLVQENEHGNITFVDRLKFIIYNQEYALSPMEMEAVVGGIEGVAACVVCAVGQTPAALVVRRHDGVTRELIHQTIADKLSEYKRLSGGIAFVDSLPRTHVGKLNRRKCIEIVKQLIQENKCY